MSRKERPLYDEHEVRHLLVEMLDHYDFDVHEAFVLLPQSSFPIKLLLVEHMGNYFVFHPDWLHKPHFKWKHVHSMICSAITMLREAINTI